MPLLRPEYGPGLPELVAPRLRWTVRRTRIVLISTLAVLVLLQLARVIASQGSGLVNDVVVERPVAFTLGYRDGLDRVAPQGDEELRLRTRPGGKTDETFTVSPLRLAPYRGDASAVLAVLAAREVGRLRAAFPDGFRFRGDGRARINFNPGYQILFQTRIDGHVVFGKRYLLLPAVDPDADPPPPAPRVGAVVTLLSRLGTATPQVNAVGTFGFMKGPLRSFRFGTERP